MSDVIHANKWSGRLTAGCMRRICGGKVWERLDRQQKQIEELRFTVECMKPRKTTA